MITYQKGLFGFQLLFRLHGSAVFKSLTPALLSSAIYVILYQTLVKGDEDGSCALDHPYTIGAFIAALTFFLAFRANFAYNRYWEAYGAVYQMHSKWLDVGIEMAAFHLQSNRYDDRKPPAFGAHPNIQCLERERERLNEATLEELQEKIGEMKDNLTGMEEPASSFRQRINTVLRPRKRKLKDEQAKQKPKDEPKPKHKPKPMHKPIVAVTKSINAPVAAPRDDRNIFSLFRLQRPAVKEAKVEEGPQVVKITTGQVEQELHPSPFLLEAAHLLSLLSAVAASTLRNDIEGAESPLTTFAPGAPWPHVDPDSYTADVRKDWTESTHKTWTILKYLLGVSRTQADRTLYNAARPFRVIGGVSDCEINILQAARGPSAKVALCEMWLSEYISREYLSGSTGKVAPPIVSRLYQYLSDGMVGYNQARKIAFIPFPFPHAQITSLCVLVACGFLPILFLCFVDNEVLGFFLNLLTVMCFSGLHEVARELENPFQNVPNDVPLNNFQAQFNESLMTMFMGYHPDAFWEMEIQSDYPPPASDADTKKDDNVKDELEPPADDEIDSAPEEELEPPADEIDSAPEELMPPAEDEIDSAPEEDATIRS